jgi:hypothetical protein
MTSRNEYENFLLLPLVECHCRNTLDIDRLASVALLSSFCVR